MLLCENLGRRHERRLKAVLDDRIADRSGDGCLARADVSLYQTVHLALFFEHIVHAVRDCALLRARQGKRQQLLEIGRAIPLDFYAADGAAVVAQAAHAEIEHHQLLCHEPLSCPLERGGVFREVDIAERLPQAAEVKVPAHLLRQRVAYRLRQHFERVSDRVGDGLARQSRGGTVNRMDSHAVTRRRKGRRNHLGAVAVKGDFSVKEIFSAISQHPADIAVVEKDNLERPRVVADAALGQNPSAADHGVGNRGREPRLDAVDALLGDIRDRGDRGPVLIGAGIEIDQLPDAADAELLKLLGAFGADAAQDGHRRSV